MAIVLDPSNGGRIGNHYGVNGKIIAYIDKDNKIAIAIQDGCCAIARASYTDFVTASGATFSSNEAVLQYIKDNFIATTNVNISDLNISNGQFIVGDTSNKGSTRPLLPSDVGLSSAGNRIPAKQSGSNAWQSDGYVVSNGVANSAIPIRSSTGTIQAADATLTTEVVTLNQLNLKIVNITQSAYDALSTAQKNNGTLYLIPKT